MPYGLYDGSLESIPGLGGYLQQTKLNQQADAGNLQNGVALMSLIKAQKAQQDDTNVRGVLAQGGDPGTVIQSLLKLGSPQAMETAKNVMSVNNTQQSMDALKGINFTGQNADAAKLEQVGTILSAQGHPGGAALLGLAKTIRGQQADVAEHNAQSSQETPITAAPQTGYVPINGQPVLADRSNIASAPPMGSALAKAPMGAVINTPDSTEPPVPPEVAAAMASGRPFNISAGANPAETTQRTGGRFSQFYDSTVPGIARSAAGDQMSLDTSNSLSISPKTWDTQAATMATRESSLANAQALAGMRNDTAVRGQDMRRDNILLANGINADGSLNDSGVQMAQAIANGQLPPLTGAALIRPGGRAIMSQVMQINPKYEAQQYGVSFATEKAFTSGKNGNTIRFFNTGIDHLGTLGQLVDALNNGDIQGVNRIGNFIATQFGVPAPNTFEAAKQIVGDEIVKAIVGAGGGSGDREKVQAAISAAASPQQLQDVIGIYKKLMGGQLHGLYQQYTSGGGKNDFNSFLTSESKAAIGGGMGPNQDVAPLGPLQLKLPDGSIGTFKSGAQIQAFKLAHGIQ